MYKNGLGRPKQTQHTLRPGLDEDSLIQSSSVTALFLSGSRWIQSQSQSQEFTPDGMPVHCRAHIRILVHTWAIYHSHPPTCMILGSGRKEEHATETPANLHSVTLESIQDLGVVRQQCYPLHHHPAWINIIHENLGNVSFLWIDR